MLQVTASMSLMIQWTFDALWLLSYRPCIHNSVNGNAATDGRDERNRKRLRSTALDHTSQNKPVSTELFYFQRQALLT